MDNHAKRADRRQFERVPKPYRIHGLRHGSEALCQEDITGVLKDISGNGLSFLSDGDYAIGDKLDLHIDLPGSKHQLTMRVVRVQVFGDSKIIGAQFFNMSQEHQKALMNALFSPQ